MKSTGKPFGRFYKNLRLQSKLTATHLVIVIIPMIVLGIFFYTNLYNMIVSDTIRKEQSASTQTAPLIEDRVDEMLAAHRQITDQEFYQLITSSDSDISEKELLASPARQDFDRTVENLKTSSFITDVKFYIDVSAGSSFGIRTKKTLICFPPHRPEEHTGMGFSKVLLHLFSVLPVFLLKSREEKSYGDMAYVTKSTSLRAGETRTSYLAIYFSNEEFTKLLKSSLSSPENVAYIINDRDSLVATTDSYMSSIYHFDYDEVQDVFTSSNNFITKNVLGEEVYAGFYSIRNTDWYMVVVMPSTPLFEKSMYIVIGFS